MQFKLFALAGLTSLAAAQSNQTLAQVLNSTAELSNLTALLSSAGLVTTLDAASDITILAPNNAAFADFMSSPAANASNDTLAALLTYHVINGTYVNFTDPAFVGTYLNTAPYGNITGGQAVEVRNSTVYSGLRANSSISGSPVNFTGGVVHIIDHVLTLPQTISDTALSFGLSSFYGAVSNASLVDTVNSAMDVTVFVPNNAAFQAIGSALPNLTMDNITSILSYHVINGTVAYSSLLSNESVGTLQGNNLTITVHNSSAVYVNSARVIIPDIIVANGVVHVIDEVLNPNNSTAPSSGGSSGQPAFSGATSASEAPYTSNLPSATTTVDTSSAAAGATATSSSSSGGAWMPGPTGSFGAAALGGLALIMQL